MSLTPHQAHCLSFNVSHILQFLCSSSFIIISFSSNPPRRTPYAVSCHSPCVSSPPTPILHLIHFPRHFTCLGQRRPDLIKILPTTTRLLLLPFLPRFLTFNFRVCCSVAAHNLTSDWLDSHLVTIDGQKLNSCNEHLTDLSIDRHLPFLFSFDSLFLIFLHFLELILLLYTFLLYLIFCFLFLLFNSGYLSF